METADKKERAAYDAAVLAANKPKRKATAISVSRSPQMQEPNP